MLARSASSPRRCESSRGRAAKASGCGLRGGSCTSIITCIVLMCRILAIAILLALATLNAACVATSHSEKHSVWLHYEPEVVTLRGRPTETTEYGPPHYGA